MRRYRIVYWLGSIRTEWHIKAKDEEDAAKKFKETKGGDAEIVKIEDSERG